MFFFFLLCRIKVAVAPLLDVVATAEDLDLGHAHAPDQGHVLALVRQKDDQGNVLYTSVKRAFYIHCPVVMYSSECLNK